MLETMTPLQIKDLDIHLLRPFKNHPFKVVADYPMVQLKESIAAQEILSPLIVRPMENGMYEIISGHRRKAAAEQLGLKKVPAIIRELSYDDAVLIMVDANLQRELISPSEKAFAYKMKYEAMRRTVGKKKDSMTKEVEAESVAFAVGSYFGVYDSSDYSFPYIAGWSSGKDMKELKASMDEIRQAAGGFIDEMNEQLKELIAERETARSEQDSKSQEAQLLQNHERRYGIYQIDENGGGKRYQFMGMDFVEKQHMQVVGAHYEMVYSGALTNADSLDSLYEKFNMNHPADFTGHSLSVSDIVVMSDEAGVKAYYVDSFGFTELPDFVQQRQNMVASRQKAEPVQDDTAPKEQEQAKEAAISFYAAECMEFPVMGEYHEGLTLQEALDAYEKIPSDRMNGVKGIGFNLMDGSDYEGNFPLLSGNQVDRDSIDSIKHFKDQPLC